jgi:hypothetical protein
MTLNKTVTDVYQMKFVVEIIQGGCKDLFLADFCIASQPLKGFYDIDIYSMIMD